jgi:CubicO group peptidase (beta-lactamase class C family)
MLVLPVALALASSANSAPSDVQVQDMLKQRIDVDKKGVGILVGIVNPQGQRYVAYGKPRLDSPSAIKFNSVFEIGSITKTFTALLLADMVVKGEVKLDDPIALYLPKEVRVPQRNGKQITLLDLATHRAGFPRNIDGYPRKQPVPTYAGLTVEEMYNYLSHYNLPRDIGEDAEYSNIGMGLLGHVLSLRAGESFENLVRKRITEPLGMKHTAITMTPEMLANNTQGYDKNLQPAPPFEIPVQEGAGALHSTLNDMMLYVKANLGLSVTPLDKAIKLVHQISDKTYQQKLAWGTWTENGTEYTNHSGTTFAYKTYIVFDMKNQRAVIVMANCALTDVDKIGDTILMQRMDKP